jgi:CheY-like chemotaxis protein
VPDTHRILVVEDNADVRGALAAILESEGYAVVEAEHGGEALSRLRDGTHRLPDPARPVHADDERLGVPQPAATGP